MTAEQTKTDLKLSLQAFASGNFTSNALSLFQTLGYVTERQAPLHKKTKEEFRETFISADKRFDETKAKFTEWKYVDLLFQLSREEVLKQTSLFDTRKVDSTVIETYLFFAIELSKEQYSRTELSLITREVNRLFPMPAMILFRYGNILTLSVINRRLHKRDESKDVLEKVTLIKDINIENPHRAHIEILFDLSFDELKEKYQFTNFVELHNAWQQTLDIKELNKRFFNELANWYFWATSKVVFPDDELKDKEVRNATGVIRLITRLMFVWFLKEKSLVPDDLFDEKKLKQILKYDDKNKSSYYKAILQNLFFATLNTEMGKRKFRSAADKSQSGHYFIHNLFRYEKEFLKPKEIIEKYFEAIPFLNGGLFECLDKQIEVGGKLKAIRIDGFSDREVNILKVPDELFFCSKEKIVDLSEVYGTPKKSKEKVRGLIDILSSYKFTIAENTPIEEEVALDPELLGKVFENLLANYNPETQTTARKQTGSFYTPREIVNYMVDESLIASLKQQDGEEITELNLRDLLSYSENSNPFTKTESEKLIVAIDNIKIIDPACGSGAFPMGVLHKLVHILHKLDPKNEKWEKLQLDKVDKLIEEAEGIPDTKTRENVIADLEKNKRQIEEDFTNNELDFGRKLFLIENCIYGIDIQPIAVQICKLRFFISLVVDQKTNPTKENFGLRPLPNLETKFVAANTLIPLEKEKEDLFSNEQLKKKKEKLKQVRHKYFEARTPKTKEKCREDDKKLREEMAGIIKEELIHFNRSILQQVNQEEQMISLLKKEQAKSNLRPDQKAKIEKDIKKRVEKAEELRLHLTDNRTIEQTALKLSDWNPYDQNTSAEFFEPEWMFGLKDGFNIVVGNPPWGAKLSAEDKELFKIIYPEIDSSTPNSFAYFVGWAMKNHKGITSYVLPDSILIKDYAKTRKLIKDHMHEIQWYENTGLPEEHRPFVYVDHDVCVINIIKSKVSELNYSLFRFDRNSNTIQETKLRQAKSKIILEEFDYAFNLIAQENDFSILKKIQQFEKLEGFMQCHEGIHTGNSRDLLFIRKQKNRNCHPLYYGGSAGDVIDNYVSQTSGWFVDYRVDIIDKSKGFYASLRDERIFKFPKIYITRTGNPFKAFYDEDTYASNNFFSLQHNDYSKNDETFLKFVLPFIISRMAQYFIRTFAAPRLGSTFIETKIFHLLKFRIPIKTDQSFIIKNVVDYIIFFKKNSKDSSFFERLIDAMVYELYLPEAIQNAKCEVLKHLNNLPELREGEDEKNLKTIEKVYKELSDPKHPVSAALLKLLNVEEVNIIEDRT